LKIAGLYGEDTSMQPGCIGEYDTGPETRRKRRACSRASKCTI